MKKTTEKTSAPAKLTLDKETVRRVQVQTDVRAGMIRMTRSGCEPYGCGTTGG